MSRSQTLPNAPAMPPPEPPLSDGEQLDQPTFHRRYLLTPEHVKAELIEGVVYMPSPLKIDHGRPHILLAGWLTDYEAATPHVQCTDNTTTILGPRSEPQPDLLLQVIGHPSGQSTITADGYVSGPPELIVEIAVTTAHLDLNAKRRDYERAGVREYVVALVNERRVVWFVLRDGVYAELAAGADGIFRSEIFGGLWLDPAALFNRDVRALKRTLQAGLASPEHAATLARLQ